MDPLWQYILIGLTIAGAVAYLIVYFVRRRRDRSGICEKCLKRLTAEANKKSDSEAR